MNFKKKYELFMWIACYDTNLEYKIYKKIRKINIKIIFLFVFTQWKFQDVFKEIKHKI